MLSADLEFLGENGISNKSGTSLKEYIQKYVWYWPLFFISLGVCISAGLLYLRYAVPKYIATTLIMVKADQKTGRSSDDLIAKALTGEIKDNLENEFQIIRSRRLMERVVTKNQFNISYYILGKFRNADLYLDAPFRLISQEISDSSYSLNIYIKTFNSDGVTIEYGPEGKIKDVSIKWNSPFIINGNQFVLAPRGVGLNSGNGKYMVTWNPTNQTINEISSKFTVDLFDKKASIIKLDLLIENLKRGQDILDAIYKEFNKSDIEDKSLVSDKTIRFIDDRLDIVSKELNGVEGNLENYQGTNQIINVGSQSAQSFENQNVSSKGLTDINIQQGVVEMIQNYFNNSNNEGKLVPSSLGISDATLSSLITHYNELQMKKERETPLLGINNPLLKDLNNQINDVKGSILENLQNITKNLKLQENSLKEKNLQYSQFLSDLPHKERVMQEIKRKQSITEGLYLYLLQKREEASISASSSSVSIYKQIDPASGHGPVEPNATNIWVYSTLLGLILPVGWISLRDLLNDKVTNRMDVVKEMQTPIIGEVGHIRKEKTKKLSVMERTEIGEQFRIIRANLSSLQRSGDKQVILVTSSSVDEGKSLISLNLAAVLAMRGKNVGLLEFDMRNPSITATLSISNSTGLTNYLNEEIQDISEIYQVLPEIPTLHIYPCGPVPPNPADLLLNENISQLFDLLKQKYDYIIIDCAPAGLVSDSFILNKYSNIVLYIIRQQHTLKKQLDFVTDIISTGKLSNVGLILNDVKTFGKNENSYGIKYNYFYGKQKNYSFWKRLIPS